MKRILTYSLLMMITIAAKVKAQDTTRLGMQDIFSTIDKNYPLLQLYEARISSVRSLVEGAKAWMPPTVALAFDRFPYRLSLLKEMTPDNQAGLMLSVQQMIPNPAKLNAKKDYIASLENVQHNDLEW